MNVDDFRRMYVIELQELRSVEDQLIEALPRMAGLVQHPQLRNVLNSHLEETKRQRDRLDQLLQKYGVDKREYEDGSMRAIIREAERWAKMVSDADARDAGIIASAQRVEHYEIAVYGTLATWARQLGLGEDEQALRSILAEEKRADERLSRLAELNVNREAAESSANVWQPQATEMSPAYQAPMRYVRQGGRAVSHRVEDSPLLSMLLVGTAAYFLAYVVHGTRSWQRRESVPDYGRRTSYNPQRAR
jgi:ferritin-like metal-binding protein YciE